MELLEHNLYVFEDTCNVYMIRQGNNAVLIDFGSGDYLNQTAEVGITRVESVLMTHHHRDQAQGLPEAIESGISVMVPHMEQDLFTELERFWQGRQILNNYDVRQDRFSLTSSVPIAGTLRDYETFEFGELSFKILPTPGHTLGSVSLETSLNGKKLVFSGDLVYNGGKLWNLSSTQWTYNGAEGVPATIASLLDIKDRKPDILYPSHGKPINNPEEAIDTLITKLWKLLELRGENQRLFKLREQPYKPLSPHLLHHQASMANTYVIISESGKALFIDFGYDFVTGLPNSTDRAARRPWLYTLPTLKQRFDVSSVDVVIPTHYHDDHVAGMNLLHDIEGTERWVPENFSQILMNPHNYDLPCLWYDPIPVERVLPLNCPIKWEEYQLTLYMFPGHTHYAVAIVFEVDGKLVMAVGDQYQGDEGLQLNYVYENRYKIGDYQETAKLYKQLKPDLILPGHWEPFEVPQGYFESLEEKAREIEELQLSLLPSEPNTGSEGFIARIEPYQVFTENGKTVLLSVEVKNPFSEGKEATVGLHVPEGWIVSPEIQTLHIEESKNFDFKLTPRQSASMHRVRIAADITIGNMRFGEQAESLVTVFFQNH